MTQDPVEQVRAEMLRHGVAPPQQISFDRRLHLFPINGNGENLGWFVLCPGTAAAGYFGDLHGAPIEWRLPLGKTLTTLKEQQQRANLQEAQGQVERAKLPGVRLSEQQRTDLSESAAPTPEMSLPPMPRGDRPATEGERRAQEEVRQKVSDASALPYVWASSITEAHNPDEIIEGLLTRGTMSAIFGESGCGKTHLAVDLAGHVAQGIPWLGRRTRAGVVVYIAAEAGQSIKNRFKAFMNHHGAEDLRVALVTVPVNLLDPGADTACVVALVRQIEREFEDQVALIIVDTLSRVMQGGEENSAETMGTLVANGDKIRHATGVHMLWVHHSGKDKTRGMRGSSVLFAAVDTEIEVRNDGGVITAVVSKQRDGVAGAELVAKLHPVPVGVDSWGKELTACVLEPAAATTGTLRKKPAKLPTGTEIALRALREAIADHGEAMPGTSAVPPGVRAVSGTQWRQRYYARDSLDVDGGDPTEVKKETEARKKRFIRARTALQNAELIGAVNDLFWINR